MAQCSQEIEKKSLSVVLKDFKGMNSNVFFFCPSSWMVKTHNSIDHSLTPASGTFVAYHTHISYFLLVSALIVKLTKRWISSHPAIVSTCLWLHAFVSSYACVFIHLFTDKPWWLPCSPRGTCRRRFQPYSFKWDLGKSVKWSFCL